MLSAVIITQNEENNIARCIESVREIAAEIVVVDSGSSDRTVEIARSLGAKVTHQDWLGFAGQKNFAAGLAAKDYILMLDADEEVSAALRISIKEALQEKRFDGWELNRKTYYLGDFLDHVWHPEWRLRLYRKGKGLFHGEIHEKVVCEGKIGRLRGDLHHYSYKGLKDQMLRLVRYAEQSAVLMHGEGKRFRFVNLFFNPCWAFVKVLLRGGIRDGYRSYLAARFEGIYTFLKYAFLLEEELKKKQGKNLWK
ncbi:MAG: SPBc2 prophage-derived glycosyltransferase SunS [Syntrophus sp. PtaU1.Bin208]|nr:MAG: SPBc2 prophage-derived glycosyltransferase SunS [Syntrophus sp. PtaU1.Bin208]